MTNDKAQMSNECQRGKQKMSESKMTFAFREK